MRHTLALLLLAACSAAPAPTRCTPGASVACVCPGVGTGAQVCSADGASYGTCVCGVDGGGDAAGDVTPAEDRPAAMDVVAEDRPDVVAAADVVDAGAADVPAPQDVSPVRLCDDAAVNVIEGTYLSTGPNGGRFTNCGACGVLCTSGQRCTAGACGARCPNGERAMCGGRMVDLVLGERDGGAVTNCGACGNTCATGEVCNRCVCSPP